MDALHLIRAAAEFADTLERDAQSASAAQLARTEEEVRGRQRELQAHKADVERYRQETERQRGEILAAAKKEAHEIVARANAEAATELRQAEAKGARLLEQARHQATELTNAARAEVEQTLEWSRAHASAILTRAQHGAGQLLGSAGLGEVAVGEVAEAIVRAARRRFPPLVRKRPRSQPEPAIVPCTPHAWSLWHPERCVRDAGGPDTARGEERSFLLMNLRDLVETAPP
jgi:F0F1-type ATP synthase membrane subunit b/b'